MSRSAFNLRATRDRLQLTQRELAEYLQVPVNTIARWECGEVRIERPEMLRLAMEHLNCRKSKHL